MGKRRNEPPEGGMWHVFARGNDRTAIFRDDGDRASYLRGLEDVVRRGYFRCIAYCLMGNHVHLMVETDGPTLGAGMQVLHGRHALEFNQRHGRVGHLFQGAYGSTAIHDEVHALTTLRYVARNPVEAGLCARPVDWPWSSSAAAAAGDAPDWLDLRRLLELLDWLGGDPLDRYRELLDDVDGPAARTGPSATATRTG